MIQFENVSLTYGAAQAVRDLTITIPDGAFVALIGANGAGKTTTAKLMRGLLKPTAGRVLVDGVGDAHARQRRGADGGDQDVGAVEKLVEPGAAGTGLGVDALDGDTLRHLGVPGRAPRLEGVARRRFDLGDLRAEHPQPRRGPRAGDVDGEVEDLEALQGVGGDLVGVDHVSEY